MIINREFEGVWKEDTDTCYPSLHNSQSLFKSGKI